MRRFLAAALLALALPFALASALSLALAPCPALAAAPQGAAAPAGSPSPPSILLVTIDTIRADRVGAYGAKTGATPTLDRLAREGALFRQALAGVPLTLPSHATILTGRTAREHGARDNALYTLAPDATTLAEHLAARGYRTAAAIGAAVLDRSSGIGQGFAAFDDQVRAGPRRFFDWEERAASQVVDATLPLLATLKAPPGAPFFLWVHFYDPHFPHVPPDAYRARFKDPYDGEIAFADAQLARLLDELKNRGLDRNLLVAVAGDHGEGLGDHGEKQHGVFVYQATQHVPFVLRGPGVKAGTVVTRDVGLDDLAPTLLDLAGAPPLPQASGRSLRPLLDGKALPPRDHELESHYGRHAFGWAPPRALVRWPHKYVLLPRPELYDLAADPREARDLAAARPELAQDLRRALAARLGPEYDRLPEAPEIDPARLDALRGLGYAAAGGGGAGGPVPEIDPKDAIAWLVELDRARELGQTGRPKEALPILQGIVKKNPDNLEATLSLILAYLGTGQDERAAEVGRAAVARWPGMYLAHFNLGNALRRRAPADAEREYRAALALHPRHAESLHALADLLIATNRAAEARALLDKAAREGLTDHDLALLRGSVAASGGDLAAADAAFREASALDPSSAAALEARGKVAFARGDKAAAASYYRGALDRAPAPALARTLGAILLDLGDRVGARAAFEQSLALEPRGRDADQVRALLREL